MMTKQKEWKTWEEKEEDDSSIASLMEMFRCVWEKTKEIAMHEEKESGSSTQSKTKHCVMNKMTSGSEDICPRSIEKKDGHPENKEVTFIIFQKNMRSMHSNETSKNW